MTTGNVFCIICGGDVASHRDPFCPGPIAAQVLWVDDVPEIGFVGLEVE